jgi:hypothetical protein
MLHIRHKRQKLHNNIEAGNLCNCEEKHRQHPPPEQHIFKPLPDAKQRADNVRKYYCYKNPKELHGCLLVALRKRIDFAAACGGSLILFFSPLPLCYGPQTA